MDDDEAPDRCSGSRAAVPLDPLTLSEPIVRSEYDDHYNLNDIGLAMRLHERWGQRLDQS